MARKKDAPVTPAPPAEDTVTAAAVDDAPWADAPVEVPEDLPGEHGPTVDDVMAAVADPSEVEVIATVAGDPTAQVTPTIDLTPPAPDPAPEPAPPAPEPADTGVPVSRVTQILQITTESRLLSELKKFEDSIYAQVRPLRVLLAKDLHSTEIASIQNHMTEVERWREKVLRWASLTKTFVSHCKSDHFVVKREAGMKITDHDRDAYQKRLVSGFLGLDFYLEGLVETIDSRVNMAKVLLRLDEAGQYHPGARERTP